MFHIGFKVGSSIQYIGFVSQLHGSGLTELALKEAKASPTLDSILTHHPFMFDA
jgi:hypothetical protein